MNFITHNRSSRLQEISRPFRSDSSWPGQVRRQKNTNHPTNYTLQKYNSLRLFCVGVNNPCNLNSSYFSEKQNWCRGASSQPGVAVCGVAVGIGGGAPDQNERDKGPVLSSKKLDMTLSMT